MVYKLAHGPPTLAVGRIQLRFSQSIDGGTQILRQCRNCGKESTALRLSLLD
jgi:hypothetical protein